MKFWFPVISESFLKNCCKIVFLTLYFYNLNKFMILCDYSYLQWLFWNISFIFFTVNFTCRSRPFWTPALCFSLTTTDDHIWSWNSLLNIKDFFCISLIFVSSWKFPIGLQSFHGSHSRSLVSQLIFSIVFLLLVFSGMILVKRLLYKAFLSTVYCTADVVLLPYGE